MLMVEPGQSEPHRVPGRKRGRSGGCCRRGSASGRPWPSWASCRLARGRSHRRAAARARHPPPRATRARPRVGAWRSLVRTARSSGPSETTWGTRSQTTSPPLELVDCVIITLPVHPLRGSRLPVVRVHRRRNGRRYLDVEHPYGWVIRVPAEWTDRVVTCSPPAIEGREARASAGALSLLAAALDVLGTTGVDGSMSVDNQELNPARSRSGANALLAPGHIAPESAQVGGPSRAGADETRGRMGSAGPRVARGHCQEGGRER